MKKEGCSWTRELGGVSRHLEDCQYVTVLCTKGCGVSFQRHCMAAHIAKSCPKRGFTCQYCGLRSTYEEVCNKHWPECDKYPLPCPNKCRVETVQRGSLEQHLNECPLQHVECEFCHAGCKEKMQRKDLQGHMEKNLQKHLSLLSAFAVKKLAEKDEKIKHLSTDAAEKDKQIKLLTTDAAEKDKEIKNLQTKVQHLAITSPLLPPQKFIVHRYSQYEGNHKMWEDGPTFYTCPLGHMVKIYIYFASRLHVELQIVPGEFDDQLQWPLHCTLSSQLLDQHGEHHLERSAELQIGKEQCPVALSINYAFDEIKNPKNGAQYLKEDCLHFRVDVKPTTETDVLHDHNFVL